MSAGTGVVHSEYNHSQTEPVHFLQIWVVPNVRGLTPSYGQQAFEPSELSGQWRVVAAPEGGEASAGALPIHQDTRLLATRLASGQTATHGLAPGRHAWLHLARGRARLGDVELEEGDGVAFAMTERVELTGVDSAEALLFDLA